MADRMAAQGVGYLWLDATGLESFGERFPTVAASLHAAGLDPAVDWLPIAPAAHYLSGGVVTDLDGASAMAGLWAVGEVACTGVHGANRLASNSLLEGMVFGARLAEAIAAGRDGPRATGVMRALRDGPATEPGRRDRLHRRRRRVDTAESTSAPTPRRRGASASVPTTDVGQAPGAAAAGHDRGGRGAAVARRRWPRAAAEIGAVARELGAGVGRAARRGRRGRDGRAAGELANLVTVSGALLRRGRRAPGDPGRPRPAGLPRGATAVALSARAPGRAAHGPGHAAP